ncbi:MAG: HAD hydrolase family protein [Pseudomonadota bacterium]
MEFLVVTDLDGTLLDHASYDWRPAAPALGALAARGIPVILASSKTAAEMAPLQAEMGLVGLPAIVENGAGLMGADAPPRYDDLRADLDRLAPGLRAQFTGFGDMSAAHVAQITGLSPAAAAAAKDRHFSEPGIFGGADEDAFVAALAELGLYARRGGRFLTLSYGHTKADALRKVARRYPGRRIVALGDAPNDAEMLEAADIGIVIRNDAGPGAGPLRGDIRYSRAEGPAGWNEMMLGLLEDWAA